MERLPPISRRAFLQASLLMTAATAARLSDAPFVFAAPAQTADKQSDVQTETLSTKSPEVERSEFFSREELWNRFRIRIFDLDNRPDYVRLHIRRSAQARESFLQAQAESQDTMTINVLDGEYLHPSFLTVQQKKESPQAPLMLEKLKNYLVEYKRGEFAWRRPDMLSLYQQAKTNASIEVAMRKFSADQESVLYDALEYIYRPYLHEPTEEDCLRDFMGVCINTTDDDDKQTTWSTVEENQPNHHYIFLAVRQPRRTFQRGNATIVVDYLFGRGELTPNPTQSHPFVGRFTIDPGRIVPITGGHTAGSMLRHELAHALGFGHPSNEKLMLSELSRFYEAFENGDDKVYGIAWETPGPNGPEFTITRAPVRQTTTLATPISQNTGVLVLDGDVRGRGIIITVI